MHPPDLHTKQPVPTGLLISVLPFVLACVVLSAVPLIAFAFPSSLSAPPDCGQSDALQMPNGARPPPPKDRQAPLLFLSGIDLTETQQDMLFKLMHDKAPAIFENEKIASKTLQELQQITKAERFDTVKAKLLAEAHGKAQAELTYLHTVFQAQAWALLSEEQRKRAFKLIEHPRRQFP